MAEYLSFEEVAAALKCSISKVRQFVIEDKRLVATRITPNGRVLKAPVGDDPFIYDLDFCSHVSDEGNITSDVYESQPGGKTVVTQVLEVGFLRIERTCLKEFLKLPENAIRVGEAESAERPLLTRERDTLLTIIGVLVELIQSPKPDRNSEAAVIREMVANYSDKAGISERTLQEKFASAKRTLQSN